MTTPKKSVELAFKIVLVVVGSVCFGAWQGSFLAGIAMFAVLYMLSVVVHVLDHFQKTGFDEDA